MKTSQIAGSGGLERGLTLLEMVVVVAILAALTTFAIRSTSNLIHEARFDMTAQTLAAYRTAVIGQPASIGSGVAPQISSFAADLGRMPRALLDASGTQLTLGELLAASGNPDFAFYTALETNTALVWDSTVQGSTALKRGISGNLLQVPSGWRGPYLYTSPDQQTLADGWGKQIRALVGTTNSPIQFWQYVTNVADLPTTAFTVAVSNRAEIAGIAVAPGAAPGQAQAATDDPYFRPVYSTVNLNEVRAQVVVQLNITGLSTSAANLPPKSNLYVDVRVFGPNPNADTDPSRPIRCVLKRLNYDTPAVSAAFTTPFLIGPKVVICEIVSQNGGLPTVAIPGFSNVLSSATAYLQPGVNFVQVGIAVN